MVQQMDYSVRLCYETGVDSNCAHEIRRFFSTCPGPVGIEISTRSIDIPLTGDILSWNDIWKIENELRSSLGLTDTDHVFLLTTTPNEFNWFSSEDPNNARNAFGHIEDFSWMTIAPPHVIAAHYILKSIYHSLVFDAGEEPLNLMHSKPRGCFYDFCETKSDLDLKLKTADICGDCMIFFRKIGIPEKLLQQTVNLMEASRKEAVSTGPLIPSIEAFESWPYPVAITRHKALHVRNKAERFKLLLDHLDSLVRYLCLTKIVVADSKFVLPKRPTFGDWVSMFRRSIASNSDPLKKVADIVEKNSLVNFRNQYAHGYAASSTLEISENIEFLQSSLAKIERAADVFFREYQLFVPVEHYVSDKKYVVVGKQLLGSHNIHPNTEMLLEFPPIEAGITQDNEVYVHKVGDTTRFWSLHPYLQERECPQCKNERMLITDGSNTYIDIYMGHRIQL